MYDNLTNGELLKAKHEVGNEIADRILFGKMSGDGLAEIALLPKLGGIVAVRNHLGCSLDKAKKVWECIFGDKPLTVLSAKAHYLGISEDGTKHLFLGEDAVRYYLPK